MRANRIAGTVAIVTGATMSAIYCGPIIKSIWGAGIWIGYNAPAVMTRIAWQDFSCVLAAVHGCVWVGTVLLMTLIAGVARR